MTSFSPVVERSSVRVCLLPAMKQRPPPCSATNFFSSAGQSGGMSSGLAGPPLRALEPVPAEAFGGRRIV